MIRVFASHDWGHAAATHHRVARIARALGAVDAGIDVWLDESHMHGNILDAMCRGIDNCDVVLVFVTSSYVEKVRTGGETDNVRREFMYAQQQGKPMLPVRFDADLTTPWPGPVGMALGNHLYIDLVNDDLTRLHSLCAAIRRKTPMTRWKAARAKTPVRTRPPATAAHPRPLREASPLRGANPSTLVKGVCGRGPSPMHVKPPMREREASPLRGVNPSTPVKGVYRREPLLMHKKPPTALAKPRVLTARMRVQAVLEVVGGELGPDEHIGEAVNRLMHSIVGPARSNNSTFAAKLACLEVQLNI